MVKHIVMFKLKENTEVHRQQALEALHRLEGAIETLRFMEVGINNHPSERSYDLVLTTHFDDKAGLDTYRIHPNHQPVIRTMGELCSSSIVVDYEI